MHTHVRASACNQRVCRVHANLQRCVSACGMLAVCVVVVVVVVRLLIQSHTQVPGCGRMFSCRNLRDEEGS